VTADVGVVPVEETETDGKVEVSTTMLAYRMTTSWPLTPDGTVIAWVVAGPVAPAVVPALAVMATG
jgi:hypothetical protein